MARRLDITKRLHDRLLEIVGTAMNLLQPSFADTDIAGMAHLRREMVELLEMYNAHIAEKAAMYVGDGYQTYISLLQDSAQQLTLSYERFRARWEHREIKQNWHEYRLSSAVMMKSFRDHLMAAESARSIYRQTQMAAVS